MRKSFKHILLAGLTIASTAMAMNAQTLTQDWKVTEGLPTATDARWGIGFDGKVFVNDMTAQKIASFDGTNKNILEVGAAGVCTSVDSKGNLLVANLWKWGGKMTSLKIWNKTTGVISEFEVTIPESVTSTSRMDVFGKVVGDITSETGGAVFFCPSNGNKIVKLFFANSAQVVEKSKVIETTFANFQTTCIAQPLTNDPESDAIILKDKGVKEAYVFDGTNWTTLADAGINGSTGIDMITLNGTQYTIEPAGVDFTDGFQIVDRSTNTVVATHAAEGSANGTSFGTSLNAEKVDEFNATIYQYHCGQFAAKYTFSIPKPLPALEARNAYAYDIKVEPAAENYTVSYRLNAPAESVKVQMFVDGEMTKEYEGTTVATYGDYEMTTLKNLNSVEVPGADVPKDALVQFKVAVTSATVAEPTVNTKKYSFYHPSSVDVDNNTDSPNFGRILVAEAMAAKPTGYHSSGENNGLYAFDPTMNPIKNSEGKYAFKGGQTFQTTFPNGKTSYDPRKVRIAADGRIFLSGQNSNGIALWQVDPTDLNAAFKPVIKGTANPDTYEITNEAGEFIAAPNVSMDLQGSGYGLKLLMLSTNASGTSFSYSGYRTDEYLLGKASTWDSAPSKAIDALTGQYTITHTNSTAIYDNEGGIWYANSRSKATEAEPTLVHINAEGVEDYKVDSNDKGGFYGGGGIRFNADFSLLAIGTSDKTLTVFEVSKDDNGAPVLTEKYKFATTIGRNLNDIAWDCANNLYIVSNSGELLKTVALPRENGEVVVAAPSSYDINISSDEYPASVYIIGSDNVWNPEDGVKLTKGENGVYTGTLTGPCNFGITTVLNADWDVVNANRYGFETDNAAVTLNQATPIVKAVGAIRVAEEGEFELTVDLKNMTVLVAGEAPVVYPEKLYLLGSVEPNAWDPADETHVANQISEGIYQIDNVSILAADENDYGYFAFTSTPGTWADVNAHRYGPAVKDTELADKTMSAIGLNGDTSYKIKSGAYSITVDLGLNTIYAVRLGDNVNDAAVEAAKVVAGIGEIRIIGEANAVSIFNAAGQAVAVNSKDAQFFVASGIYVVVVDGKATKVLVK